MRKHRVRVYYRSYLPGEIHPKVALPAGETDDRWRDESSMDFAHDSHSKWETMLVAEPTDAAVKAALEGKHPKRFLIVDKITWLDEAAPD